jgi:hypothetical protein
MVVLFGWYVYGNFRRIDHHLRVRHHTVNDQIDDHVATLPNIPR